MAGRLRSFCDSAVQPLSSQIGIASAPRTIATVWPPPSTAALLSKGQRSPLGLHSYRSLSPTTHFLFSCTAFSAFATPQHLRQNNRYPFRTVFQRHCLTTVDKSAQEPETF